MRAGVHSFLATLEPAPFPLAATQYDVGVDSTAPLIAFDAEISQFSATMTRFILDTVLNRHPSEFPYSAYLLGLKQAWIFTAPFDTRPISVELSTDDGMDSLDVQTSNRQAAGDFLFNLVNQQADDHSRPAE